MMTWSWKSLGRGKTSLYAIGLLGPMILFSIYLFPCLIQVDSHYITDEKSRHETSLNSGQISRELHLGFQERGVEVREQVAPFWETASVLWSIEYKGRKSHRETCRVRLDLPLGSQKVAWKLGCGWSTRSFLRSK